MVRNPSKIRFADGHTRPVTPMGAMLDLLQRLDEHDAKADAHHVSMRREAEAAKAIRSEIADLMRAAGVAQMWDFGTLYRLSATGGLIAEDCPEAADVKGFPAPAGDTADEEARAGGMPGEAEPRRADSFAVGDRVEWDGPYRTKRSGVVREIDPDGWRIIDGDRFRGKSVVANFRPDSPHLRPAPADVSDDGGAHVVSDAEAAAQHSQPVTFPGGVGPVS